MKEHDCRECEQAPSEINDRRKFLRGAAVAAGGLVLGLQVARAQMVEVEQIVPDVAPNAETFLDLPPKVLEAVGGFAVIENAEDKIIVARTGPINIAACAAICTHKGGTLTYDHESGQFVCPSHGARFEITGKVVEGPAKSDLKSYQTRAVLGLSSNVEEPQ